MIILYVIIFVCYKKFEKKMLQKISGNFGPKLNGSVRSNRKRFEKTGPPFEMDHFSRSDRSEFWLNGSRPIYIGVFNMKVLQL